MKANDLIESVNFIPTAKENKNAHASTPEPMKICNDKLTILPVKNVEPSIFLVDGYIRKQTFKINILPEINKLIYSFYQKMNGTSIVWKINNIDTLLNNINQDEFKSIESNVYPIHTSFQQLSKSQLFLNTSPFKFYLKIHFDNGRFKLYIVLVSMPSILDHIHFIYQLYCNELNNYWSSSDHLFYKDSLCKLLNNDTRNHLASTSNNSINSNPDVTINDIKSLNINSLTFYCSLDILNINIGDKHKYNLSYYYNSRLEKNHLLFDGQLSNNFEMKYDEFKFQWNINNHILNDLKSVNINKMNKYIVSDIYFNMWSLSLTLQNNENNENKKHLSIQIGLELCVLPSNISGLIIELKLSTNSNILSLNKYSQSSIQTFGYDVKNYQSDNINMELNNLNNLNELNIFAQINVIESFDENEEEISFKVQKKWFEKQKRLKSLPISTKYYDFVPLVTGTLNNRKYFQHISIDKYKRFDEISVEEIRFQETKKDTPLPKLMMLKRRKPTKKARVAKPPESGTVGWIFRPHCEYNPKKDNHFFYQHICVGEENCVFKNKSTEELHFEDMIHMKQDINNIDTDNGDGNDVDTDGSNRDNKVRIIFYVFCVLVAIIMGIYNIIFGLIGVIAIIMILICKRSKVDHANNNKINNEFKTWCADNICLNGCYLLLVENGVNELNIFKQLRDDDLLEIGIKKIGDRLKILGKIRDLKTFSLHSFDMIGLGFVVGCVFSLLCYNNYLPCTVIAWLL